MISECAGYRTGPMIGQLRATVDLCCVFGVAITQLLWRTTQGGMLAETLTECGDAGDAFADDQFVNVVGAFVGVYAFEIVHVAHDGVIVDDAVGAQNVAGFARGFQSDGHVVHFQHGDVRGIHLATVFQPANVQRKELALHDFGDHPGEFFLHQLMAERWACSQIACESSRTAARCRSRPWPRPARPSRSRSGPDSGSPGGLSGRTLWGACFLPGFRNR